MTKITKTNYEDLVSRLDERSINTYRELHELKEHIKTQNGYLKENMEKSNKNATWINAFKWIIVVGATLLGTHLSGLW